MLAILRTTFTKGTFMSNLHVVLGASGGAGLAITKELVARGLPVRAVNRSGSVDFAGVEPFAADVDDPAEAARAVAGAAIVYMAAQPPYHRWPDRFPGMLATVVDAAAEVGARFVMVDNLYMYGPGAGSMSETTPHRATEAKGVVRREMADALLEADRSGRLPVLIGRLSDYFGPRGDNSTIAALAFAPLAKGRGIRWPFQGEVLHSVAYLPDVARALVDLATTDDAYGRVWVLPHASAITGMEFLALVNDRLDEPVKASVLTLGMFRLAAPFHKPSRELLAIRYQFEEPFVVDDTSFRAAMPDFMVTPLESAVAETVAWYRDGAPLPA